jgi:prepilin signal peptidase PulO-like enzyme (type II secretory pathway)
MADTIISFLPWLFAGLVIAVLWSIKDFVWDLWRHKKKGSR